MRDLIVVFIVFGCVPFAITRPYLGVLLWSWLSYMNPHRLAWGFAYNFPFVMVAALVTFVGLMLSPEKKRLPMTAVTCVWMLWVFWFCITTPFAVNPELAQAEWVRMIKIQMMVFVTLLVMRSQERINWLVWCIALSIGFFGVKGGMFVLATGGNYLVWGPSDSFISGNNEIALAMLVVIPLMRYLQMQSQKPWIRRGLMGAMALCAFSVVGSYSRGAFVGAAAMLVVLWLRSRKKFLMLIPIAIIAGGALMFMPDQYLERMGTIKTFDKDDSALGRLNAWVFAVNLANDRPVLGGGFTFFWAEQFQEICAQPQGRARRAQHLLRSAGGAGLRRTVHLPAALRPDARAGAEDDQAHPQPGRSEWADDLAGMLQVSFAGFGIGGAFLGLAYFDLPYHLMAIMVLTYSIVRERLNAPQVARSRLRRDCRPDRPQRLRARARGCPRERWSLGIPHRPRGAGCGGSAAADPHVSPCAAAARRIADG